MKNKENVNGSRSLSQSRRLNLESLEYETELLKYRPRSHVPLRVEGQEDVV